MQKKKIEVLAPAGNMESLKAAAAAGCDAVYLGGTLFSARAFAGNFSHDELIDAVKYCHIRGIRVYVTMNTILFEDELPQAFAEAEFLYSIGIDALLIQDLGLFDYLHSTLPDFELHCSTQMHIHNLNGVRFMKDHGAKRIVLARETPIELIRKAAQENIEIEVFAYGALCISYSGQCLMSQAVKNRSGNRGMCAQCCRLKYSQCLNGTTVENQDGDYLLSPKDLSTLDRISELLDTGISSLKIEGRMKRPEYVYLVTKTFREAVDAWQNNQEWHLSEERKQELLLMFNRGFTNGHLFHSSSKERMSHFRPNHQGVRIGTVIQYSHGRVLVKLQAPLYQHDGLRILNEPYDTGLTAVRIEKNGLLVNQAGAGDEVWLDCHSKPVPKPGQPLQKTSDAVLLKKIDDQIRDTVRRIPIEIQAYAHINSPLHLTATDPEGNTAEAYSTFIIEQAKSAPLTDEKMIQNLVKAKDQPYKITVTGIETDDVFLPVSAINDTRRTLLEKLSVIRSGGQSRNGKTVYQPSQITRTEISMPKLIAEINSDIQIRYPEQWNIQAQPADTDGQKLLAAVDEEDNDNALLQNSVISQIGSLNHPLDHVIAGMTFNCSNSYALAFLLKQKGIDGVILSSELSNYQISRMLDSFSEVYDFVPYTYRLVFGRRRLMYIKDGIGEEVIGNELRDLQQNVYPLKRAGRILEVLEQQPYQSENPYAYGSYIIFTDEQKQKACEIQEKAYEEVLR